MATRWRRALDGATIALAMVVGTGCSTGGPSGAVDGAPASGDAAAGGVDAASGAEDAAAIVDAGVVGADGSVGAADAAPGSDPYRNTIEVDGRLSFGAGESFATTTAGYTAYVSWDDEALYVGYGGADVASGDAARWLFVYVDTDPGGAYGAPAGEAYNTQRPVFPAGFAADYYYRWQASGGVEDLKRWSGTGWVLASAGVAAATAGDELEVALSLSALGDPEAVGVTILWINETMFLEAAYGGLYPDSFTDGYHAFIPISRYLEADFESPSAPNDPGNRRP